ncbi:hypothetical protein B0H13DRAFT_2317704 [Mycena leptocephala]|nr:hypothetical protein B0H13DRAFT_2317704 [Mycena leptocephala]
MAQGGHVVLQHDVEVVLQDLVSLKVAATRAGSSCASKCASSRALDELLSPAATECVSDDVVVTRAGATCASTSSSSFVCFVKTVTSRTDGYCAGSQVRPLLSVLLTRLCFASSRQLNRTTYRAPDEVLSRLASNVSVDAAVACAGHGGWRVSINSSHSGSRLAEAAYEINLKLWIFGLGIVKVYGDRPSMRLDNHRRPFYTYERLLEVRFLCMNSSRSSSRLAEAAYEINLKLWIFGVGIICDILCQGPRRQAVNEARQSPPCINSSRSGSRLAEAAYDINLKLWLLVGREIPRVWSPSTRAFRRPYHSRCFSCAVLPHSCTNAGSEDQEAWYNRACSEGHSVRHSLLAPRVGCEDIGAAQGPLPLAPTPPKSLTPDLSPLQRAKISVAHASSTVRFFLQKPTEKPRASSPSPLHRLSSPTDEPILRPNRTTCRAPDAALSHRRPRLSLKVQLRLYRLQMVFKLRGRDIPHLVSRRSARTFFLNPTVFRKIVICQTRGSCADSQVRPLLSVLSTRFRLASPKQPNRTTYRAPDEALSSPATQCVAQGRCSTRLLPEDPQLRDRRAGGFSNTAPLAYFEPPVTIRISGVGIKALTLHDLDTINDAEIDRTALSWTVRPGSRHRAQLPTRLELRFATLRLLESFLFALSYVRYTASTSNHSVSIVKARRVVLAEADDSYLDNLSEIFLDMRASPADNCLIHSLPLKSYPLSSSSALPKIRLGVCSRWRTIATETAGLWRIPSFALGPSFFGHRDNHHAQMALWLARAKSSAIILSLTVEDVQYLPHETFDVGQNNLAFFAPVHTLRISSPHSQLYDLLGAGGSLMPALRSLSLFILRWDPSKWTRLCQSAPLLRDLTIQAEGLIVSLRLSPGFISAFQWSQLTVLTLKLDLGISVWVLLFSQCTSLRTGRFIVWNEGPDPHYPAVPIALNHLESLRVTFRGACDLTFFDHLTFPRFKSSMSPASFQVSISTQPSYLDSPL